jgi:hypothetical protein
MKPLQASLELLNGNPKGRIILLTDKNVVDS